MNCKRLLAAALCLLLCAAVLAGCAGKPADFREANWGDSQNEVSESEPTEYVFAGVMDGREVLYFDGELYGHEAEIFYTFDDNALIEAQARFQVADWILLDVMADYAAVSDQLTEAYGAPLSEDYRVWHTDHELYEEYKNDPENMAMYWQILTYANEWKTETGYYRLTLSFVDARFNYELYACPADSAPV